MTDEEKGKEQEEVKAEQEVKEPVQLSHEEHEALLAKVKEADELKDKLLRSAADYENAKKRLTRDRDDFVRFKEESLVGSLLPILDNFERAIQHAENSKDGDPKGLLQGIQMVSKQFMEALKAFGLVRLETVGKDFDPHLHEAIASVKEEGKDHEILDEIEAGYMLKDKLLRAAKVRVRISESESKE